VRKGLGMEDADGKQTLSREEFAFVLFEWLALRLTEEKIQWTASLCQITTWTPELRRKFREELIAIQTWMLVDMLQPMLPDKDELLSIVDAVHSQVYEHLAQPVNVDYRTWGASLTKKWDEYNAAMACKHQQGPLWELAKKIDANLFGECRRDFQAQSAMMTYIGVTMKNLGKTLMKYEVR